MFRSLAFLLALFFTGISAWDHFEFDITFFCYYHDIDTYNLQIYWMEVDRGPDDELSQTMHIEPHKGRFSFKMNGAQNGDQFFANGYTPKAYITHDCTENKEAVNLELEMYRQCPIGQQCHYRIIYDITDKKGYEAITPEFKTDLEPFEPLP